jgi:predicted ester cyclase
MSSINTPSDLESHYREYISAINKLPATSLRPYLADTIVHNDKSLSPEQYHELIILKSVFTIDGLVADPAKRDISARLYIELPDGRKVKEFVFYHFNSDWRIERVWSMLEFLER